MIGIALSTAFILPTTPKLGNLSILTTILAFNWFKLGYLQVQNSTLV